MRKYNFSKAICITVILLIFVQKTFSYTLDEDVLERCGQKHPNDFAGRIVCNNRMQTEICLEKEEGRLDKKINQIIKILSEKSNITLEQASDQINKLKDFKEYELRSSVINRSDKVKGDNGYELKVLVLTIYSKCTSGQNYLVNILEDKNKIITALRVWIQFNENKKDEKSLRLSRNDWSRSHEEIESLRIAIEKEKSERDQENNCKKTLLKTYDEQNESLNKRFDIKNNPSEKIIYDRLILKFLSDDYSVSSIKESEDKSNIRIWSKCDGLFPDIYVNYEFFYTNKKIDKIESAFYIKDEKKATNEKPFLWMSQEYKDREIAKIKKEDEERAKKIANDELNEKIKKDGELKLLFIVLFLFIALPSLGYAIYKLSKRNKANDENITKHSNENNTEKAENIILNSDVIPKQEKFILNSEEKIKESENVNLKEKFLPKFYSEQDMALMNEFRSRNPFVKIDIPPKLFNEFIQECKWLQEKTKNFPDKENQIVILNSLEK